MQPIIGITAGRERSDANILKVCLIDKYTSAIIQSGGIPFIIPTGISTQSINPILKHIDAIMLTGGGDIETKRFKGQNNERVYGVDLDRDELEIELVLAAEQNKKPLLGICRGIQVINVALGGDLYTDIQDQKPGALRHDWYPNHPRDLLAHEVEIKQDSLVFKITDMQSMEVNSLHHQAIKRLASGLIATAFAPDGIIEAVEKRDHPFFLGIQWHPEWLFPLSSTQKIFKSFVNSV